jgi:hypothetical protein
MPVCRLTQKGPRKRHLAAEACTTTGSPTRERFRFLLGPPSYNSPATTPTVLCNGINTNISTYRTSRHQHVHYWCFLQYVVLTGLPLTAFSSFVWGAPILTNFLSKIPYGPAPTVQRNVTTHTQSHVITSIHTPALRTLVTPEYSLCFHHHATKVPSSPSSSTWLTPFQGCQINIWMQSQAVPGKK